MLLVGLTGGIASGKSVVSKIFKSLGAYVIDADVIAHELIMPGLPAWSEVVERFGREILSEDNSINRKLLGSIVFKDPAKRKVLNAILHPKIFEEAERQRQKIQKENPDSIIILDVALLVETGAHERVDVVILVYADEELQIRRMMERDGLTQAEAMERISTQMSSKEKKQYVDYIIDTSGAPEEVERQTMEIFRKLKKRS